MKWFDRLRFGRYPHVDRRRLERRVSGGCQPPPSDEDTARDREEQIDMRCRLSFIQQELESLRRN